MDAVVYARPVGYRLVEFLGEGLNSCVYRAIKEEAQHGVSFEVALKILKSEKSVDVWRNEFSRLSALRSSYCVSLLGWEFIEEKPTLILEYVKGVTLAELCRHYKHMDEEILSEILAQVALGLGDLNSAGLFHGDLNLHNIMVDVSGCIKLVDFGLNGHSGSLFVTPEFAAPQVLAGEKPNYETDLQSLDAIGRHIARQFGLPTRFKFEELASHNEYRGRLAEEVRRILQRKSLLAQTTKVLTFLRDVDVGYFKKTRRAAISFMCLISLFCCGDQIQAKHAPSAFARIHVRTLRWVYLEVNGRGYGYSPTNITVPLGRQVNLKWQSAEGSGRTSLTLEGEQPMLLDDEFFRRHTSRHDSGVN